MSEAGSPVLALVLPCYNEAQVLPLTIDRLRDELDRLSSKGLIAAASRIVLVDDGSADATWSIISDAQQRGWPVVGIKLSRNYGHQYALYAGLMEAAGDVLISLDADLQDDLGAIEAMLTQFREGREIVFGVRSDRSSDGFFKRRAAALHYRLLQLLGIETIPEHADFRLMSRRAVEFLREYREANLYLRGIVPLLGLETGTVSFTRAARAAGSSKYRLRHMLSLSVRGATSFSIVPLRMVSALGILVFTVSLVMGTWTLAAALFLEEVVPGWASTVIPIYLLGGLQLLGLGIVGEYIGKAYMEVKRRPLYQIDRTCGAEPRSGQLRAGPGEEL